MKKMLFAAFVLSLLFACNPSTTPTLPEKETASLTPTPFSTSSPFPTATLTLTPSATPIPIVNLPDGRTFQGMYDPYADYSNTRFDIYHNFVDWNYPEHLDQSIWYSQTTGQFPMITLEPNPKSDLVTTEILTDIVAGKYDDVITANATIIKSHSPQKIIIRWGHQMDLCGRYDWSRCIPEDYIAAYRYTVDYFRKLGAANVLWMYAPVGGLDNSNDFYPGDEYITYVGITGLVSEEWDNYRNVEPPHPQNYLQLFHYRYQKASLLKKPIIVAEFSVSYIDIEKDKTKWLTEAIKVMNNEERYPLLAGWVYFNVPGQTFPRIGVLPDFQISPKELQQAIIDSRPR